MDVTTLNNQQFRSNIVDLYNINTSNDNMSIYLNESHQEVEHFENNVYKCEDAENINTPYTHVNNSNLDVNVLVSPAGNILSSSGDIANHCVIDTNSVLTIDDETEISFNESMVLCSSPCPELDNSNNTSIVLNNGFLQVDNMANHSVIGENAVLTFEDEPIISPRVG